MRRLLLLLAISALVTMAKPQTTPNPVTVSIKVNYAAGGAPPPIYVNLVHVAVAQDGGEHLSLVLHLVPDATGSASGSFVPILSTATTWSLYRADVFFAGVKVSQPAFDPKLILAIQPNLSHVTVAAVFNANNTVQSSSFVTN